MEILGQFKSIDTMPPYGDVEGAKNFLRTAGKTLSGLLDFEKKNEDANAEAYTRILVATSNMVFTELIYLNSLALLVEKKEDIRSFVNIWDQYQDMLDSNRGWTSQVLNDSITNNRIADLMTGLINQNNKYNSESKES